MSTKSKNKFLDRLLNLGQTGAMASDPAVMQASGYKSTPDGVKHEDTEGAKQLRENLAVLSGTTNTLTNIGLSGIVPALSSEAGAVVGGIAGNKIGEKIDERVGTTYGAPVLGFTGAMIGGSAPYTASRYWNGLKTAGNSGKTVRPDYANGGGEFVDALPINSYSRKGVPIRIGDKGNVEAIAQANKNGITAARAFMNSPAYRAGIERNIALAKRLGYEIDVVPDGRYAEVPVEVDYSHRLDGDNLAQIEMNPFTNNPKDDLIRVDALKHKWSDELETSVFHEGVHHGRFGTVPPEGNTAWAQKPNTDNTLNFYQGKLKHLFNPDAKIPDRLKVYLNDVDIPRNEGLTNVLEIGHMVGLDPNKGYPGFKELQRILLDVKNENPQYSFIIDALNMKKPKRVGEALTGQYEHGGKLSANDYVENIKKYLLGNAHSPEEKEYIKNFKA